MPCPFCDPTVIATQQVLEKTHVRVLHNIRPANPGQCLVTPKRHIENIRELTREELLELMATVQFISQKYTSHFAPIGINYGFNEGSYAGQMVPHFHFHIMPRVPGDKEEKLPHHHLFHRDPQTKRNLSPDELSPMVTEIAALLQS